MIQATREIGLGEATSIVPISRTALYTAVRAGEVAGARKIGDRIWVAPRSSFEKLRDRLQAKKAARSIAHQRKEKGK